MKEPSNGRESGPLERIKQDSNHREPAPSERIFPVAQAHPYLDPDLPENNPATFRYLYKWYLTLRESGDAYNDFLNKFLYPDHEKRPLPSNLAAVSYYLNEAVSFLGELIQLVPQKIRTAVSPRPDVMGCPDILELLHLIFGSQDRQVAFEAQRKLYLAKLFFDVDHCWEVQRGAEHKEFFEAILDRELFRHLAGRRRMEICYSIRPDGQTMEYAEGPPKEGQECWSFDVREIELLREGRPVRVNVYYYSCRFKRETLPYQYERGARIYQLTPTELWPGLTKRRSASIVSKMIRKAENDPRWVEDLIGAMFIVENLYEVEILKETLFDVFGGVFRIRNAVDTLNRPEERSLLNPWSGPGYGVYKADFDLLYNPQRHPLPMPYFFTVEVQIHTLESYLRTIHSEHYAGHQALKRRQFLEGLLPYLFPASVYGPELNLGWNGKGDRSGIEPSIAAAGPESP